MSVTLSEIARRAGCSTATVSRALNDTACVNGQTRTRILAAADALGDRFGGVPASAAARRPGRPRGSLGKSDAVDIVLFRRETADLLVQSRTGLTMTSAADAVTEHFLEPRYRLITDFHRHIVDGALSILSAHELKAVQQFRRDLADEGFVREINAARRRGVLLLGEPAEDVQAFVARCTRPVVLIDILGVAGRPVVTIDNAGGIASMVRHVTAFGHRDIGFAGNASNPSYRERRSAFHGWMAESGLPVRPEWEYDGPGHVREVARGTQGMLARKRRPTAVVCCSDWVAMGVVQAAQSLGLRVPHDLSVTGFDDVDAAALVTPPLTTVQVPTHALGAQAARLLLDEALGTWESGAPWGCEVRLRTNLVVRDSTGAPAVTRAAGMQRRKRRT